MDRAGEGRGRQARAFSRRGERPNLLRASAIAGAVALHAGLVLAMTLPVKPFERSQYVPFGDSIVVPVYYPPPRPFDPPGCGLRFLDPPANTAAIARQLRVSIAPAPVLALSVPSLRDMLPSAPSPGYRAGLDLPLQVLTSPEPVYPSRALRAGLSGSVEIEVVVGADGKPLTAKILRSSGHRALDEAALAAVLDGWRFQPRVRGGDAVEAVARVPIEFVLPGDATRG